MSQDHFDFDRGSKEADSGMEKAALKTSIRSWQIDAGRWFMLMPEGTEFCADDLIKSVGLPDEGINKNNAVGAFFNGLAKSGFIQWTGKTMKSERIDRHTGMNRIWRKRK